ncbi:MAG: DUF2179 domain-containing protein [Myxococcaceae bacterium]|nr:DUF2179 domain-containing protein [Myxococcaceae bacterium]
MRPESWRPVLHDLLLIFLLQALYVAITTVRWIILVRGHPVLASCISFFENLLYIVALGMVVTKLGDPMRVVVYALGYATGALVGFKVEEKLALGYTMFQIITRPPSTLAQRLREAGMGVTVWGAEGREGDRLVLMVLARRKWTPMVMKLLQELDPNAFVLQSAPQAFRGGFLDKYLKQGALPAYPIQAAAEVARP